jgi:hypothetical protein
VGEETNELETSHQSHTTKVPQMPQRLLNKIRSSLVTRLSIQVQVAAVAKVMIAVVAKSCGGGGGGKALDALIWYQHVEIA